MSWFAAHLIMSVKLKGKRQRRFPVWENIVVIEADSEEQAFRKAEHRGRLEEGDEDGSFTWGPTRHLGVRRHSKANAV